MLLKRKEKKLRAQYQNTEYIYEKTVIIERIKLIKQHRTDKMKENRGSRIIKVAQQIKSNVDNGGKIWEIKLKVQKKSQRPHTIKKKNNKKQKNRIEYLSQIIEEYQKYHKNLLETRQLETAAETQIQCKTEKEFQQITNRQGDKKDRIREIIIRKAIRRMKNKKAADD